jgi:hypothetical protein
MKKLIALIAVLSYVPFAHAAEGDWTHSGEYRLQYFNNENDQANPLSGGDTDQFARQRTKLNTTVRAGEKMTFNLGLVHNASWGSNADQTPNDVVNTDGLNTSTASNTNNLLLVNEAYASWQASDEVTVKAGRISQTLADGSVVSANEWEPVQKAFDAVGAMYDLEQVRLAAFAVTGAQGNLSKNSYGNFYGIAADWKTLPAFLKMAHLHYIQVSRDEASYVLNGAPATLDKESATRIGLTLAGDTAGVDYKATYAMYTGENDASGTKTDIDASMMDLEVGYSMPAVMNLRVHAGYHSDSGDSSAGGDNETYSGFHYNTYQNAGLMDVVGWGNLTYMRAGVALSPMEDLTVGLEYLMFEKTEKGDSVYSTAGNGATVAGAGVANEDDIGTELDLVVTKKYSNNFAIQARYGQFAPGDAWANDDTFTQYYLETKLSF